MNSGKSSLLSALDRLVALPQKALLLLVWGYRFWLSPWLGSACRFEPTCSAYALQALQRHGALRGSALSGWRVLRCNPWCDGGCDPVPQASRTKNGSNVQTSHFSNEEALPGSAAQGLFTHLALSADDGKAPEYLRRKVP